MKRNKPSATALFVANGMYYNINQEILKKEIPEDVKIFSRKLIEHLYGINTRFKKWRHLFYCFLMQLFSINGFFLHFLIRKKCIEKQVIENIEAGYEQVVILGAGYDTLCSRLVNVYPKINFVEIDHPATSANKVLLFKELEWNKDNIEYVEGDLKKNELLFGNKKIKKNLKTIFVCEGVFMYLQQKDVVQILNSIKHHFINECKFIFTFMEESSTGSYLFYNARVYVKFYLKLKNEPFTWGMKPENMEGFLENNGWHLLDLYDHKKLRLAFLSNSNRDLPLAIGENIVVCEKLSN